MIRLDLTTDADVLQKNNHWIALAFPFKTRETFDSFRVRPVETPLSSVVINKPIVLASDIISYSVSSSLESPTGVLSLNLAPSFYEKVDGLGSEDWIIFWAFDNKEDYDLVKKELNKFIVMSGEGRLVRQSHSDVFNDFKTAPKFIGQISSIQQTEFIDKMNGAISVSYDLMAYSYPFLNAKQYFDQVLNLLGTEASRWWGQYQGFSDEVVAGTISIQLAIQKLLKVLIATGPNQGILKQRPVSPNERFSIPPDLVRFFDPDFNADVANILDLFNFWFGVQKYENDYNELSYKALLPDISPMADLNSFYETKKTLMGSALLGALDFNDVTTFSIIQQYLASPINEVYCAMRPRPKDGKMFPTVIFRQNPRAVFKKTVSSLNDAVSAKSISTVPNSIAEIENLRTGFRSEDLQIPAVNDNSFTGESLGTNIGIDPIPVDLPGGFSPDEITFFSELPTWKIDPKLIYSKKIGLSGSNKINYVQITPVNWAKGERERNALNNDYALPIADTANILRNGLHTLNRIIPLVWITKMDENNNAALEKQNGFFNKLMASITFNSHLKFSGTVELQGIQLPIECGDCCEIDNVVYLIENIQHSGGIMGDGQKMFTTVLTLSGGVVVNKDSGGVSYPKLSYIRHSVTT